MGLVSTHTIPRILDLLSVGKLETAALMVTHGKFRDHRIPAIHLHRDLPYDHKLTATALSLLDFTFEEIQTAYDVFQRAAETNALKVNIEFQHVPCVQRGVVL